MGIYCTKRISFCSIGFCAGRLLRRDQQAYIPATTTNTLPDITETDQKRLKEIIWKERRCELAMEGWRRDDLMRQKRFGTVMRAYATKYNTSKGANFIGERYIGHILY